MYLFFKDGALCCAYKNYVITDLNVKLEFRGQHYNMLDEHSEKWEIAENGRLAQSRVENVGTFELRVAKADGGLILQAALKTADTFTARKCYRLYITGFLPVKGETFIFNNPVIGRVRDFEMGSKPRGTAVYANQSEEGVQYLAFKGAVNGRKGYYGFLGFTTFKEDFGEISFNQNGEFAAFVSLEERWVYPNSAIKTDKCFIYIKRGDVDVLTAYGKRIAKDNPLKKRCKLPTGWCSWYYYGPNISQEKILENTAYAKKYNLPIEYIQIDDGWQKCYGDWEENERFQMGMKALADEIKSAGFTPGIWITPFVFAPESQTFKEHPDWFVRNENGVHHPNRLIDYSVKGAKEWLYNIAKKISVDWGYRYIKIDLVSYRLAITGYKKKGFNALKNFKEMLRIMRSAVTEDTVFLTCTSPVGASAGLAEGVRISDDIFERWDSLKLVAKEVFRRYYCAEYINTDPDCLMVRTKAQHDEDAFRICTRDEREIRSFITFMSASGGAVMLSDKFALLNEGDIDKIRTLFPINPTPAKPLDLFERDIPSVLYYGKRNGLDMYALFNWENCEDTLTVDFGAEKYVKGYYSGKEYGKTDSFRLRLAPHDSEIIYVADDKAEFAKLGKSIMPFDE